MKNEVTSNYFTVPEQLNLQSPASGKYGLLYRDYLKKHHNGYYTALLVSGKLTDHLRGINEDARRLRDNMLPKYLTFLSSVDTIGSSLRREYNLRLSPAFKVI